MFILEVFYCACFGFNLEGALWSGFVGRVVQLIGVTLILDRFGVVNIIHNIFLVFGSVYVFVGRVIFR